MTREHFVSLGTFSYPCTLRKSKRARHLLLHVNSDSSVELVLPWYVSYKRGIKFVESRRGWLSSRLAEVSSKPRMTFTKEEEKKYREQAREYFGQVTEQFAARLGVKIKRIRIGNFKSQWGSAGADGRLSFNWRLMLAPEPVARYVAVHEVVHLKHANHSVKFWQQVEHLLPDYSTHKQWLKQQGSQIL